MLILSLKDKLIKVAPLCTFIINMNSTKTNEFEVLIVVSVTVNNKYQFTICMYIFLGD